MGLTKIKERRRRRRIDVTLPLKITYDKKRLIARTKNLSLLGALIEAARDIPRGRTLNITIRIPKGRTGRSKGSRQISCLGVVFRCQPVVEPTEAGRTYDIGVFFRSFFGAGERTLGGYIDEMLSLEKKIGKKIMQKRRLKQKGGMSRR